jgi:hypothetical protein
MDPCGRKPQFFIQARATCSPKQHTFVIPPATSECRRIKGTDMLDPSAAENTISHFGLDRGFQYTTIQTNETFRRNAGIQRTCHAAARG